MEEEELTGRIETSGAAMPNHLSIRNNSHFTSRGSKSLAPDKLKQSAFLNYLTSGKETSEVE
jgi:hypothetical protein